MKSHVLNPPSGFEAGVEFHVFCCLPFFSLNFLFPSSITSASRCLGFVLHKLYRNCTINQEGELNRDTQDYMYSTYKYPLNFNQGLAQPLYAAPSQIDLS